MEMQNAYTARKEELIRLLKKYTEEDCMVAFSGGVDSSVLLKLACQAAAGKGTKVYAVTVQTELHPMGDLAVARQVAAEVGAEHHILAIRELAEAGIEDNPIDRCYRCKKYLFMQMHSLAVQLGAPVIIEGTNEDDLHVYRPGIRAVREIGIKSPLAEAGLTKEQVRLLAGELSLSVSARPSTPCLATRFPYGVRLDPEEMKKVEQAEEWLRQRGYGNVRVRVHGDLARLEIDRQDFSCLLREKDEVITFLKALGYDYVTLDLEGFRSGSMDEKLLRDNQ